MMQKITSRKKLFLYGCSGIGVNMLSLIVGTYLCSALLTGGFGDDVASWTYLNKDLVIPAVWSILILGAKVLDGVIDIPFSSFTDNLKTRWGRRRPSILIGFVPMVVAYVLFLVPLNSGATLLNTIWFGALLCVFYAFYTLTMLTYYATFAEITVKEQDTVFVSNVKSVCDVVYFIFGYALLPVFVGMGINIRYVALIFLPLTLFMLIPLLMLKEKPTKRVKVKLPKDSMVRVAECTVVTNKSQLISYTVNTDMEQARPLSLVKSIACSFKNKTFIYWMLTAAVMNFGLQLFLGGINELFSTMDLSMTVVMACAFAPVPFTMMLYNKIVKKFGLGVAYRYILAVFSLGMLAMFVAGMNLQLLGHTCTLIVVIGGALLASFAISAFFSVGYTVPSHLAQREFETKGISVSSMYFAVQGLFEGVAAGLATGIALVNLKSTGTILYMPLIVASACMLAFVMSFAFPKTISKMGKVARPSLEKAPQ